MTQERRIRRRLNRLGLPRLELQVTMKAREFARATSAIDHLIDDDQVDVLRALQDGRVTLAELVELARHGNPKGASVLVSTVLRRPLWTAWEAFEAEVPNSKTALRYDAPCAAGSRGRVAGR